MFAARTKHPEEEAPQPSPPTASPAPAPLRSPPCFSHYPHHRSPAATPTLSSSVTPKCGRVHASIGTVVCFAARSVQRGRICFFALACGLQVKVAQHLRFFTRSQLVWSSVSQTVPRPAIWWASCARQVRPCELTTGPSTFTHGSERGLAPHPAPSDRHGQGACGPALGRAHRRMSPPARDELHVLSVCDRALIPLLDELRDQRPRRA